jgi:hypothetical protein
MKKLFLSFVALCSLIGTAFAQPSPQTYTRIRDGGLPNNLANVYQFQITFPTTYYGLYTASGMYYYDGDSGTFRRWWGTTSGSDTVTNLTPSPWVSNFNYLFDGVNWNRQRTYPAGDALSSTLAGTPTISLNEFFDGTTYRRWLGNAGGADAVVNTTRSPWTSNFLYSLHGATWDRVTSSTVGDAMSATPQGLDTASYNLFYNGTNYQRWTGETWDDSINLAIGPSVLSLNTFYNLDLTKGARVSGEAWTADMAGSANPNTNSFGVFRDTTNSKNVWWGGPAWSADMTLVPTPGVTSLGVFRDTTNSKNIWWNGPAWSADMTLATPAPDVNALGVFRDTTNSKNVWWGGPAWSGDMTLVPTPGVTSLGVFRDTTNSKNIWWNGPAWGDDMTLSTPAPNVNALSVFRDTANSKNVWWNGETWDDDIAGTINPNVNAFGVYRDVAGSKTKQWKGEDWDTTIDSVSNAPSVLSLGAFYDADTTKGYRANGTVASDAMAATPTAPFTLSLGTFYNGTNYQRWTGLAAQADSVSNSTPAPWVANLNYGFNGTSWDRLYTITTQADGQAASLNGLIVSNFNYAFNGTTFDLMRLGSNNELLVTDIASRPGEDAANDWRKIKKEETATSYPAATDTAAFSALTVVLAAIDVSSFPNFCLYIENLGGGAGATFTDVQVNTSPDNSVWTSDLGWTSGDILSSGQVDVYCVSNGSYRYIRVQAQTAGTTTTARAWFVGNKN